VTVFIHFNSYNSKFFSSLFLPSFGRHQDYHSCLVGWQAQVEGTKKWRVQSPLQPELMNNWPEEAWVDLIGGKGDKPVTPTYDFEVRPGEVFVWSTQWFHNTTVDIDRSFALTGHIDCGVIKSWAWWNKFKLHRNYFHEGFWFHISCNHSLKELYKNCWRHWFT